MILDESGEVFGVGDEAEAFLQAREVTAGKDVVDREPGPERQRPKSKVAEILTDLRGRDRQNPVTVINGADLVSAEIEDNAAGVTADPDLDIFPTDELIKIQKTLGDIQFRDDFSYEELARVVSYLRTKRNIQYEMFFDSFRINKTAEQNAKVYGTIVRSIYDAMPAYTVEARLPDYPVYAPTERPLKALAEKVHKGEKLGFTDVKQFYADFGTDVSEALKSATADTQQWSEQINIISSIDEYRRSHLDEIYPDGEKAPAKLLVVTVKNGTPEIDLYTPTDGASLQEDLRTEDGSQKFIFDPTKDGADMKYIDDIANLYNWNTLATEAQQVTDRVFKKGVRKPKITKAQQNALVKPLSYFIKAIETDQLPDTYDTTVIQLRDVAMERVNKANIIANPTTDSMPQAA